MMMVVEEGIRGGISQVSHSYFKVDNKYTTNDDENKESSFLEYQDANDLYGYPMTEKLPVRWFKWIKNVSKIDEEFIKKYYKNRDIGLFLKVDIEYPEEIPSFAY